MLPIIPEDAIDFIRGAFAEANLRATNTLARQPSMHEEGLDFQLIAALDEIGSRLLPGSGAAVEIETHWLGGRRHFEWEARRWEVADIALLVAVRRLGRLLARKVALLQSKRLYSSQIPVAEMEAADFRIGIGRLFDRTEAIPTLTVPRSFGFSEDSVYGALTSGSTQVEIIEAYQRSRNIPIFYNLYNPPEMPYRGSVPPQIVHALNTMPKVGCRVMGADDAHAALSGLPKGSPPKFAELVIPKTSDPADAFGSHGWRLEHFVADELLRCRQGRLFEDVQDQNLSDLMYGRTGPITSAIMVTIDLAERD